LIVTQSWVSYLQESQQQATEMSGSKSSVMKVFDVGLALQSAVVIGAFFDMRHHFG